MCEVHHCCQPARYFRYMHVAEIHPKINSNTKINWTNSCCLLVGTYIITIWIECKQWTSDLNSINKLKRKIGTIANQNAQTTFIYSGCDKSIKKADILWEIFFISMQQILWQIGASNLRRKHAHTNICNEDTHWSENLDDKQSSRVDCIQHTHTYTCARHAIISKEFRAITICARVLCFPLNWRWFKREI